MFESVSMIAKMLRVPPRPPVLGEWLYSIIIDPSQLSAAQSGSYEMIL